MLYLVVDDDPVFADSLARAIGRKGYQAHTAYNIESALLLLDKFPIQRIILDLKIGNESGLSFLTKLQQHEIFPEVVLLTGYSSIRTAVEAIKLGATEYLCKPVDIEDIFNAFEKTDNAKTAAKDTPLERPSVKRIEWEHIQEVLMQNEGNVSATARALGMHRRTLQRKLQKRPVHR